MAEKEDSMFKMISDSQHRANIEYIMGKYGVSAANAVRYAVDMFVQDERGKDAEAMLHEEAFERGDTND